MHFPIPFLFHLLFATTTTTRALAHPNPNPTTIASKRDADSDANFSYDGPVAKTYHCPGLIPPGLPTAIFGAPPNYPNFACIPMSSPQIDWIGINLELSNASAVQAFADGDCEERVAYVVWPQGFGEGNWQFCVRQSDSGGVGNWGSVRYVEG